MVNLPVNEKQPLFALAFHCLISNREGLGTSLLIMGLAATDPHSLEVQTELYKIPKFGVIQGTFD